MSRCQHTARRSLTRRPDRPASPPVEADPSPAPLSRGAAPWIPSFAPAASATCEARPDSAGPALSAGFVKRSPSRIRFAESPRACVSMGSLRRIGRRDDRARSLTLACRERRRRVRSTRAMLALNGGDAAPSRYARHCRKHSPQRQSIRNLPISGSSLQAQIADGGTPATCPFR